MSEYKESYNIKYFPVRRFSALTHSSQLNYLHLLGSKWKDAADSFNFTTTQLPDFSVQTAFLSRRPHPRENSERLGFRPSLSQSLCLWMGTHSDWFLQQRGAGHSVWDPELPLQGLKQRRSSQRKGWSGDRPLCLLSLPSPSLKSQGFFQVAFRSPHEHQFQQGLHHTMVSYFHSLGM